VQQRSAPTLTAALQYGVADRHQVGVTGATGLAGTVNVLASTGFSCGIGYGAVAASWTTGSFIFKHRIEGANTKQFNSKTITVSGKLYQDTGGSRNLTVAFNKPTTTLDTFSAVTNLGTSSAIAVPTGVVTSFSYTLAMGATDASLGLEVLITDSATNTVVTKNYIVGDLQVEIGSVATVFEQRPIQLELLLCLRYYEKSFPYATAPAQNAGVNGTSFCFARATGAVASAAFIYIAYKVPKRAAATSITTYNPSATNAQVRDTAAGGDCSATTTIEPTENSFVVNATGNAGTTLGVGIMRIHWASEHEL
jgi:hypothetical protein